MRRNICLLALFFMTQSACSSNAITVQKSEEPEFHTTNYIASGSSCVIAWSVQRSSEFKQGFGFSETSKCALPIAEQKPYRVALLSKLMADTGNLEGVRGFAWGGLQRGDATDEYANRMMAAAAKSKEWDKAKGRPAQPKSDPYVVLKNLLNKENVFSEIVSIFADKNFMLQVQDVEEIQIKEGKDKVPFNCIVLFTIKKK